MIDEKSSLASSVSPNEEERQKIIVDNKLTSNNLSGLTKAGLIVSLIGAAVTILVAIILITMSETVIRIDGIGDVDLSAASDAAQEFVGSVFVGQGSIMLIGSTITIVLSSLALTKKTHGVLLAAGILGLMFGNFIGGILTLVGMHQNK